MHVQQAQTKPCVRFGRPWLTGEPRLEFEVVSCLGCVRNDWSRRREAPKGRGPPQGGRIPVTGAEREASFVKHASRKAAACRSMLRKFQAIKRAYNVLQNSTGNKRVCHKDQLLRVLIYEQGQRVAPNASRGLHGRSFDRV